MNFSHGLVRPTAVSAPVARQMSAPDPFWRYAAGAARLRSKDQGAGQKSCHARNPRYRMIED